MEAARPGMTQCSRSAPPLATMEGAGDGGHGIPLWWDILSGGGGGGGVLLRGLLSTAPINQGTEGGPRRMRVNAGGGEGGVGLTRAGAHAPAWHWGRGGDGAVRGRTWPQGRGRV